MKRVFPSIAFAMAIALMMLLAGCGGPAEDKDEDGVKYLPTELAKEETEYHKTLAPLVYKDGEEVENVYYRTVFNGDDAYYEVQPEDETDRLRAPLSNTVIYGIDEGENYIEMVTLTLGDGTELQQYQMHVRLEGNTSYAEPEGEAADDVPADDTAINAPVVTHF
jgi:hypothetical protein